jgi:antitoxin (DNA-binding transcriptional repressor) of toxin-antitoxin stability system
MTAIVINIHEAKAKLSEYLDKVAAGEQVVICSASPCRRTAVQEKRTRPRPSAVRKARHSTVVLEPMPDDWLDAFYNGPIVSKRPTRARGG